MAKKKICIDAGHYGKYNRSPVVPEYYESDMVWKLHLMQKEILEGYGFEVILTRNNQAADRGLYDRGYAAKGWAPPPDSSPAARKPAKKIWLPLP